MNDECWMCIPLEIRDRKPKQTQTETNDKAKENDTESVTRSEKGNLYSYFYGEYSCPDPRSTACTDDGNIWFSDGIYNFYALQTAQNANDKQ